MLHLTSLSSCHSQSSASHSYPIPPPPPLWCFSPLFAHAVSAPSPPILIHSSSAFMTQPGTVPSGILFRILRVGPSTLLYWIVLISIRHSVVFLLLINYYLYLTFLSLTKFIYAPIYCF